MGPSHADMVKRLSLSIGQSSDKGRKPVNQDFHGACIPKGPLLVSKGVAISLADGISSSEVSQEASAVAVKNFLDDYYCTPESWSVKTSVQRVLQATNSWLYRKSRSTPHRFCPDKGYVCTFTAVVIKAATAHVFYAGDTRVYRLVDKRLELLTEDHRVWVTGEKNYLNRALGLQDRLEIDYRLFPLDVGDIFVLATDGVYEYSDDNAIADIITNNSENLDHAAAMVVAESLRQGSPDNLSVQIVRIDGLPEKNIDELCQGFSALPLPPLLVPRMLFDGYEILRELHASSRSHVLLAEDKDTNVQVVIKTPSIDLRADADYLERFLMEEWVAMRINNAHVLRPCLPQRKRSYVYIVNEYIRGQTLAQWMLDNPAADVETVRNIVEQIARGLNAFHRLEMLHQDLRPANIMIDHAGTVKIIDFGATRITGVLEISSPVIRQEILGTAAYTAPEYFIGETGSERSDLYSLAVIAYQMLSGRLPYGAQVAKIRTKAAQVGLVYQSVLDGSREIPVWIDGALRKALHPQPHKRYATLSEFVFDLRHPNKAFLYQERRPLLERNPLLFWQSLSLVFAMLIVFLLYSRHVGD